MHDNKKKYLKILRIEIEDLQEDIDELIEQSMKASKNGTISNYIFLENLVIFRKELKGLEIFFEILDSVDPNKYESMDELIDFIRSSFMDEIKECGLIHAIGNFVERKLIKVRRYVIHE